MAFSRKLRHKKVVTNWRKKWSFGRKTILICLFRNLQHNQSGERCGFESHRPPTDIRQRSLGSLPLPPPPHPIPSEDFIKFFKTILSRNLLLCRNCEFTPYLFHISCVTSIWKLMKHTICYSAAKLFLFQKTTRLVISFLHVIPRNLSFFNISDKA